MRILPPLLLVALIAVTQETLAEQRTEFSGSSPAWLQAVGKLRVPGSRVENGYRRHKREDCSGTLVSRSPDSQSADIVVTPSRFEGFGLTALEAMSLSKPVIASTAGGLPEVLGETGCLVKVGDVAALANAILELAENPDLRACMGKAARARAEAEFSLPHVTGQLIAIYASLVSE